MRMSVTMSEDWNQSQTLKRFGMMNLQGNVYPYNSRCCRRFARISSCSSSVRVFAAFRRIHFFFFRDNTSSIAIHQSILTLSDVSLLSAAPMALMPSNSNARSVKFASLPAL
jgi:hypothetical protein